MEIHPTAVVHPKAGIGPGVKVGPYCTVGENVEIGRDTVLVSHVVLEGPLTIGERCRIFPFASVGAAPQVIRYRGEPTVARIGNDNVIREFVTLNRGTVEGGGETVLGNGNLVMAYSHIAHDCIIGNHVILANSSTLAGHILVEDFAIIGGLVAIHQFARVGCYAMAGGASAVAQDIPPYMIGSGNRARLFGLNSVGLRRHKFPEATISALKQAYRILFRSHLTLARALDRVEKELPQIPEIRHLCDFMRASKRGICR